MEANSLKYYMQFIDIELFACDLEYRTTVITTVLPRAKLIKQLLALYKIQTQPFFNGGTQRVYTYRNH